MAKRKAASAKKPKAFETPTYANAMVLPGESAPSRVTSYNAEASTLIAQALVGTAASAANINATVCAAQKLRLYRPTRAKSKLWRSHGVSRGVKTYLSGRERIRPGYKAQSAATQAGEFEEVEEHPFLTFIADPDPTLNGHSWMRATFWMHEMTGAAFSAIGRNGREPVSMYFIPSQYVNVIPSETTLIDGYRVGRNQASSVYVPFDDMFYFRAMPHPGRPWLGWTWVNQVSRELDCEAAAVSSEIGRWLNGGNPGAVFEVIDSATPEQFKQIVESINRSTRGVNRAGENLFLQKTKLVQYGAKPHEMQYVEGQNRIEAVVYRHAGIPEPLWKMSESNLASASASMPQYSELTILPRIAAFEDHLNERILPMFEGTDGYFVAFDNPVREDVAAKFTQAASAFTAGLLKRNEARAMMGLEADTTEFGDAYHPSMTPAPAMPSLTDLIAQGKPNANLAGRDGSGSDSVDLEDVEDAADPESGAEDGADDGEDAGADAKSIPARSDGPDAGPTGVQEVGGPLGAVLEERGDSPEYQVVIAKSGIWFAEHDHGGVTCKDDKLGELPEPLARIVNSMASKVQRWLTGVQDQVHANTDGTINLNGQTAAFDAMVRDALADALAYGGQLQSAELDSTWDVTPEDALKYLEGYRVRLAQEVTVNLEADLNTALRMTMEQGATPMEASRLVADALGEQAGYRSDRIARSETSHLANRGADLSMQKAGIEEREWLLAGGPCPICEAAYANRPKAKVGQPFWRLGETITGTDHIVTFREVWGGDAHPQCRCGVAAVIVEEGE